MKIIAHRGDSANFPENTPEGWEAAYRNGALAIEADIRLSKDGFCICAHDADLRRLFNRPERPEDLTLDELLRLENADGGRIVVLADVLRHASENRAVLLDLKDETPSALDAIWQAIAQTVPSAQRDLVIAGCHTLEAVQFFAARAETGILGFIRAPEQAEAFRNAGASLIRLWERDVTVERVAQLRDAGAEVWVTTGGRGTDFPTGDTSPRNLAALTQAGVSGVLVNDVAMTKSALEANQ
jgi:glycerophosphoryl diester phosphodiesterase